MTVDVPFAQLKNVQTVTLVDIIEPAGKQASLKVVFEGCAKCKLFQFSSIPSHLTMVFSHGIETLLLFFN